MSIAKQALLYDVDYSAWANQHLLAACSKLSAEEVDRDLKTGHGSIAATLRHIYYAERVWLKRLRANALPPLIEIGDQRLFRDPSPEPGIAALATAWPAVWEGLHDYVDTLTDADLAVDIAGIDCRIPRWRLLLHLVNHSTLHRGQVVGMLRQLGNQPPQVDLFSFHMVQP